MARIQLGDWAQDDPKAPWNPQAIEGRERVELGVIEFHSPSLNPGLLEDFYAVTDDCAKAGVIVDIWLMDIATVLRKHGYELAIFRPVDKSIGNRLRLDIRK